jgi:hypothetical protein
MSRKLIQQIAGVRRLTTGQLRDKYAEVFGELTNTCNRAWLVKRIAWRLQALAEGDLSERARQRAAELANDADLRLSAPRPKGAVRVTRPRGVGGADGPRPAGTLLPGTTLTRSYKGETLEVTVLADGFECGGHIYRSLSAVAKAITGTHTSGSLFFHLNGQGGTR